VKPLFLPNTRAIVENLPLATVKLDKVMAESQSRVASYLDVRYPEEQIVIFLLGGKAVKAGRFLPQGREILTVTEAMEKLRNQKDGTISFYEISKLLMVVILGTFIFEPTHGRLKTKLINFNSLVDLFDRKHFTGYVEVKLGQNLNYLTFLNGQAREGFFSRPAGEGGAAPLLDRVRHLLEGADENGEINLYESVGEDRLHEDSKPTLELFKEPPPGMQEERAEFTSEILDLCLAAIYEDLFRLMSNTCLKQMEPSALETLLTEGMKQVSLRYPSLFEEALKRPGRDRQAVALINFELLLKAKSKLPPATRDQEFITAMNALASIWLNVMRRTLSRAVFEEGLKEIAEKIAMSRKAYQGNFTIIKFLYEFSRLLEKVQSE